MPEMTEYAPGTPCWVDLSTSSVDAAGTFYATLFGWEISPVDDPNAGGYTMLLKDGKPVAALSPLQHEGQPPAWTTYVSVEDADKTTEIAQSAGGTVIAAPFDVFDAGRMAILADPAGAMVALWQGNTMKGASIVDEPGSFSWAELSSRDTAKAEAFYTQVFGWAAYTNDMGGMTYTEFKVGDKSVAGMMAMNPEVPAQVPSYWMPYFEAHDIDASFAEAKALGATPIMGVETMPQLRFAILRDPQGATFGLLKMDRSTAAQA
jgi:predicted enzyme related to lactoylglutathione lyase